MRTSGTIVAAAAIVGLTSIAAARGEPPAVASRPDVTASVLAITVAKDCLQYRVRLRNNLDRAVCIDTATPQLISDFAA